MFICQHPNREEEGRFPLSPEGGSLQRPNSMNQLKTTLHAETFSIPIPDLREIVLDPPLQLADLPAPNAYELLLFRNELSTWLHVPRADYPTVPACLEALKAYGSIELELSPPDLQRLHEGQPWLVLLHERGYPLLPYKLQLQALDCQPTEISHWVGATCKHATWYAPGQEEPCTWALWDLSGLINEPGHRQVEEVRLSGYAKGQEDPCVRICTSECMYRVTLPITPPKEGMMTYAPGAFAALRIPL